MLTVQELVSDNTDKIAFNWIAGLGAAHRVIPDVGMAGADLVGHLNLIHPSRIQVFGKEELLYYTRFEPKRRIHHLEDLVAGGVPAILMADSLDAPDDLRDFCNVQQIPLLSTSVEAAKLIDLLRIYLGKRLAPRTTVHGVFLDVLGLGVLIMGDSGLGKSELALELISRGHGLVADDAVELSRTAPGIIEGHCPALLQNLLEVRGLGLLDIRTIFGETSVRRKMRLKLIVQLVRANAENFERLPVQDLTQDILDTPIRRVMLQVAAGRNLAVLVEAAVRNTILSLRGIDTMGEFIERQALAIMENSRPD
ncbi:MULTISPECIES: HPr(Ser) kinase/phosphatase [Alcaligenaceae]|jgi:HPr kinase/phosphorylase|uniref:HPr kinase/phosphorylase n=1 Tax=Neopusillimonas maritima TaxID=2026239 RepID=A0ABX9N0B6_9BURK|nr:MULTISPECIES: HPr(Ser) kinase/phosphatase [Alcaligenaceae]QIM48668.1 HPr kinase/phosphorylase [Pusillimonas sp. DMV24BSW_D]RII84532.1 HPr kinase/phosphorylase [Neopusillimonas maritima]|tara:strand:- start:32596 stop:33525 length:930 start_codon:yes stop_codon:yes gene_type:complete